VKSEVNVCKVCVDEVLSFISESSGEILLSSYQQKCIDRNRVVQDVRRRIEVLDFIN
jgi:hypothetical protein